MLLGRLHPTWPAQGEERQQRLDLACDAPLRRSTARPWQRGGWSARLRLHTPRGFTPCSHPFMAPIRVRIHHLTDGPYHCLSNTLNNVSVELLARTLEEAQTEECPLRGLGGSDGRDGGLFHGLAGIAFTGIVGIAFTGIVDIDVGKLCARFRAACWTTGGNRP